VAFWERASSGGWAAVVKALAGRPGVPTSTPDARFARRAVVDAMAAAAAHPGIADAVRAVPESPADGRWAIACILALASVDGAAAAGVARDWATRAEFAREDGLARALDRLAEQRERVKARKMEIQRRLDDTGKFIVRDLKKRGDVDWEAVERDLSAPATDQPPDDPREVPSDAESEDAENLFFRTSFFSNQP
jgi:hypothetical protein